MKYVLAGVGAFVAVLLLGLALGWVGLVTQRPMAKYAEETRAQTYDTSRQFQQGTNRDIARYCAQMHADPGSGKAAIAALIRTTSDTYEGRLTPDNQTCVSEAKGF